MQPFCFFGSYHKMKYINQNFYDMKKILITLLVVTSFLQISCSSDTVNDSPTTNPVDVYVAGQKNNHACYWKNNQLVMLNDESSYSKADSIIVKNNTVHISGTISNNGNYDKAYWKNGVLTNLTQAFSTSDEVVKTITGMDVVGDDVYFVGYTKNPLLTAEIYNLVYWKNGVKTYLAIATNYLNYNTSIKVLNNNVYVSGRNIDFEYGYYKKNELDVVTPSGINLYITPNLIIKDFAVNNNEILAFGSYLLSNKIHNITTNTDLIVGFANDAQITNLCFDNNNMYYSNDKEIYKNGSLIYTYQGFLHNGIEDFKVLNGNIYKLESFGDIVFGQKVDINGKNTLTTNTGENFNSLYIVQN
jgi:hypothetical protein